MQDTCDSCIDSEKSLRVFNDAPLCRVIANSDTPAVVGIGHEDDQTLAGEVADYRVMTPTHAGEVVPKHDDLKTKIEQLETTLETTYQTAVESNIATTSTALSNAYESAVATRLQKVETALDPAAERHFEAELLELSNELETAYRTLEQAKEHEDELAETVEEVRDEDKTEAQAEMARKQRRYKIAIAVLVVLLLVLGVL